MIFIAAMLQREVKEGDQNWSGGEGEERIKRLMSKMTGRVGKYAQFHPFCQKLYNTSFLCSLLGFDLHEYYAIWANM